MKPDTRTIIFEEPIELEADTTYLVDFETGSIYKKLEVKLKEIN